MSVFFTVIAKKNQTFPYTKYFSGDKTLVSTSEVSARLPPLPIIFQIFNTECDIIIIFFSMAITGTAYNTRDRKPKHINLAQGSTDISRSAIPRDKKIPMMPLEKKRKKWFIIQCNHGWPATVYCATKKKMSWILTKTCYDIIFKHFKDMMT